MKKKLGIMLALTVMCASISACSKGSTTETTSAAAQTVETTVQEAKTESSEGSEDSTAPAKEEGKKILTIAQGGDISTFDHQNHNNGVTGTVLCNFSHGLVERDDNNDWYCVLAESYEMIDDATWEFKLRDDVTWHNGDPFTAADVKYTYERAATDDSLKENHIFAVIKEVQIVDDYTVRFITDGP